MFTCVHFLHWQLKAQTCELSDLDTAIIIAQLQSQLDISGQQNKELRGQVDTLRSNNDRLVGMFVCIFNGFSSNGVVIPPILGAYVGSALKGLAYCVESPRRDRPGDLALHACHACN